MPIESWPKITTLRPLRAWVVTAANAQSTSASAVPSVILGSRPVSGQVPTFRCESLPYCASAPFTACANTTPGFGPQLPQVKLIGRVLGELLQERDHAELRERPRVRRADEDVHARVLELLGDDIGLLLAVNEYRRVDDLHRRAVGQLDPVGEDIRRHLARCSGIASGWPRRSSGLPPRKRRSRARSARTSSRSPLTRLLLP